MAKKASPKPSVSDILADIRDAERSSKERLERASAEAAQIVDEARMRSGMATERTLMDTRSEIERLQAEKDSRLKGQMDAILRERREAEGRIKDRASANFPRARKIVLDRIAGMLND